MAQNPLQRAEEAFRVRLDAARFHRNQWIIPAISNGDEQLYESKIASFTKALPHSDLGEVEADAYVALEAALASGRGADFELIPLGGTMKLTDPQGAYCFDLVGADSRAQKLAIPPTLSSAEAAGEMVELYWQALTRDVAFSTYSTDPLTNEAAADLNLLVDFPGARMGGQVTTNTLFRGTTIGDLKGPYVSQFLYKDIPYGASVIVQQYRTPLPTLDYLTTYSEWLDIQRGIVPAKTFKLDLDVRYIRNSRDLAWYVHQDFSFQAYSNACHLLLSWGRAAINPANPYLGSKTQSGFSTFGAPNALDCVASFANAAIRASWCAKWLIHRRLRPEAFGGRIHNNASGATKYPVHADVLRSAALKRTQDQWGSYLLPSAYPEGAPTHPSYPAGHAVIAGACVTALKVFFNEDYVIPDPVVASEDGSTLLPYGDSILTVGDELNKLAANIAIARNAAGMHYRSDGIQGLLLGEEAAMGMLHDIATTYSETFTGFTFTRFDGTKTLISPNR